MGPAWPPGSGKFVPAALQLPDRSPGAPTDAEVREQLGPHWPPRLPAPSGAFCGFGVCPGKGPGRRDGARGPGDLQRGAIQDGEVNPNVRTGGRAETEGEPGGPGGTAGVPECPPDPRERSPAVQSRRQTASYCP